MNLTNQDEHKVIFFFHHFLNFLKKLSNLEEYREKLIENHLIIAMRAKTLFELIFILQVLVLET